MTEPNQQYLRKFSLLVLKKAASESFSMTINGQTFTPPPEAPKYEEALDLSQLRFVFNVQNVDEEGPTNCSVRVFNLSEKTREQLLSQRASKLVLQAGYESSFGVIFQGDIKQYRTGRMDNKDTFLDILAADGDLAYNYGFVSSTVESNQTSGKQQAEDIIKSIGLTPGYMPANFADGFLPRGKVKFGMGRTYLRDLTFGASCSWSIQDGKVNIIPLKGYLPGEVVVLNSATGLIGVPEQTQDGVKARVLLNPKIGVGGLVQIDQKAITQLLGGNGPIGDHVNVQQTYNLLPGAPLAVLPSIARDGVYRVFVAEHNGDTRGQEWYTNLTCLAVDSSSGNVVER